MTLLPIVGRELRVAARRGATYWTRVTAGALATLMVGTVMVTLDLMERPAALQGNAAFWLLSVLAFTYCVGVGMSSTADCLSRERREGTLGLLYLTNLKSHDVVLGKLAASSLHCFYVLITLLPIIAIPLMLGGVSLIQVAKMSITLLNTLWLSLAVGVWVSARSQDARKSGFWSAMLMLAFVGGPWMLEAILEEIVRGFYPNLRGSDGPFGLVILSPVFPFMHAFSSTLPGLGFVGAGATFWLALLLGQGMSWLLIANAGRAARRATLGRVSRPGQWIADRWRRFLHGGSQQRLALRRRLLPRNPFLWLLSRDRTKLGSAWGLMFALSAIWFFAWFDMGEDSWSVALLLAIGAQSLLKLWMSSEVITPLWEARQNDALELILTTPLSIAELVRGHFLALARVFARPMLFLWIAELLIIFNLTADASGDERLAAWFAFFANSILLVTDPCALVWVGMWSALHAKNFKRAQSMTVGVILVLPWLVSGACVLGFYVVMEATHTPPPEASPIALIITWFVPAILVDCLAGFWRARGNVLRHLRFAAAEAQKPAPAPHSRAKTVGMNEAASPRAT